MDRGKLDHKSVPGVICEVTEHGSYRIVCKRGVLKDCLTAQHFQEELIKKPEHYDLQNALENWQGAKKISICEALRAILVMGGQGFFYATAKGIVRRMVANAGKMVGSATLSVTLAAQHVRIIVRLRVIKLVKVFINFYLVYSGIGHTIREWDGSIAKNASYYISVQHPVWVISFQNGMRGMPSNSVIGHPKVDTNMTMSL